MVLSLLGWGTGTLRHRSVLTQHNGATTKTLILGILESLDIRKYL